MKRQWIVLLTVLLVSSSSFAQNAKGALEISPFVGLRYSDNYGSISPDQAPIAGLRLGFFFTNAFEAEVAAQRAFAESGNVAPFNGENVNLDALRLNLLYHFLNDKKVRPYLTAGAGLERIDSDNLNSQNDIGYNGGIGFRFYAGQSAGLRLEGRYVTAKVQNNINESWENNYEATIGLFFLLGAEKTKEVVEKIEDADGDGVVDNLDQCPSTPKGSSVDANGCPAKTFKDEDGDGIADEDDQCPSTPQDAPVDENGCALDSDNDGVKDYADRCPNTEESVEVDNNGCPVVSVARGVLKGVTFKSNSPELTLNSETVLSGVADELKKFPDVKVEIQGHSDSVGDETYNLNLSQKRAETVLEFLVANGVNRAQLSAVGYGETQPIADNNTSAGRAQNRRVELKWLD
ncbi:MAG: OmpA family protein [Bdellovibrionales bacterium]|nr:OmpA family protein [Bdellovibrionales bacterium]